MYNISYRLKGQWFWRTIKVKGDAVSNQIGPSHILCILPDESTFSIPLSGTLLRYSKERHFMILKQMEAEAGQKIPLKAE